MIDLLKNTLLKDLNECESVIRSNNLFLYKSVFITSLTEKLETLKKSNFFKLEKSNIPDYKKKVKDFNDHSDPELIKQTKKDFADKLGMFFMSKFIYQTKDCNKLQKIDIADYFIKIINRSDFIRNTTEELSIVKSISQILDNKELAQKEKDKSILLQARQEITEQQFNLLTPEEKQLIAERDKYFAEFKEQKIDKPKTKNTPKFKNK